MVYRVTSDAVCDDECCLVGRDPYFDGVLRRQLRDSQDRYRGYFRPMFEVLFPPGNSSRDDTYRCISDPEHEIDRHDEKVTRDFVRRLRQEIREEEEYQCRMAA